MKLETKFRATKVIPFLKTLPRTWFESIQQMSIHGTPDILACICGRFVAIEIKSERGKLTKLQELKLASIARSGGYALVINPGNWELMKTTLKEIAFMAGGHYENSEGEENIPISGHQGGRVSDSGSQAW